MFISFDPCMQLVCSVQFFITSVTCIKPTVAVLVSDSTPTMSTEMQSSTRPPPAYKMNKYVTTKLCYCVIHFAHKSAKILTYSLKLLLNY